MGSDEGTGEQMGPVLQIVGDGMRGEWITWRWSAGHGPGGIARRPDWVTGEVRRRLLRAVPRMPSGRGRTVLTELGFDGELTDPTAERSLMAAISRQLLPPALLQELLSIVDSPGSGRIAVRVAPSPSAAMVPWGLLFIDEARRLLDVADVSWIGPVLPRDVTPAEDSECPEPTPWTEASAQPPLHIIDPEGQDGRVLPVLGEREAAGWIIAPTRASGGDVPVRTDFVHCRFTRHHLSRELATKRSRLFLLGHCVDLGGPEGAGFLLSDPHDSYGVQSSPHGSLGRLLTAADLLRGTLNQRPVEARETVDAQSAGHQLWPMPPRVAIIACASGMDMTDHEPFGLVTAALINGADTVHATLWPLPTDFAFAMGGVGPELTTMAHAIDAIQTADDPVTAACDWQRGQLNRWRETPCLETSPLLWGSLSTVTAPPRRIRVQGVTGEAQRNRQTS